MNSVQKSPILMVVLSPVLITVFCVQPNQISLDVKLLPNVILKRKGCVITRTFLFDDISVYSNA